MTATGGDRIGGLLRDWLAGAAEVVWVLAVLGALFTAVAGLLLVVRAVLGLPLWSWDAALLAAVATVFAGPLLLAKLNRDGG